MTQKIIAIICTVISLIGIVFLGFGLKSYNNDIKKSASVYNEIALKVSSLEAERRVSERTILELENQMESIETKATTSIIMCGMDERIYTTIYPLAKEKSITGVIAIYGDNLPGGEGLLSEEQINELVFDGWSLIPAWTDGDGDNGITAAFKWIVSHGFDSSAAVFINESDRTDERVALLISEGFTTIITDAENGGNDDICSDSVGEIWYPYSIGYKTSKNKTILDDAISVNGNIFYTVGFSEENELFNEASLTFMFSYINTCVNNHSLFVSDIASVRSYRIDMNARISGIMSSISPEIDSYKNRIAEIDSEVNALCSSVNK